MKKYLVDNGTVNAVVAANDGMAAGVIAALSEAGLAGKVPVSGQDANLASCQYIVEGKQTITVYKPLKSIANKAAEMAVEIAQGREIETNNVVNNGIKEVPSYLLDVVAVTKENMMDTVIKDGFHTFEEVYANVPVDERPANPAKAVDDKN